MKYILTLDGGLSRNLHTSREELEILRKGFDISPEDFDKFLTYIGAGIFDQECSLEGELENWAINVKQIKE